MGDSMSFEEILKLGESIYSQFLKHRDIQFIVCPASLGDTVNIGAFISTYKKIHGISRVILVLKSHQVPLGGFFPAVDEVFEVTDLELNCLRIYISINKLEKSNNVLYGYFKMKPGDLWGIIQPKYMCFVDEYKSQILDIPLNSTIDRPDMKKFESDKSDMFKDAVLLLPWCSGLWECSDVFWNRIISFYKDLGVKDIYTNVGNPRDRTLEGTKMLQLSFPELFAYSNQFKKIIGIRSGIFDVLALRNDVELNVITPNLGNMDISGTCEIDTSRHPLYFGLKNLNPDAMVREYTCYDGCEDIIVREINR